MNTARKKKKPNSRVAADSPTKKALRKKFPAFKEFTRTKPKKKAKKA